VAQLDLATKLDRILSCAEDARHDEIARNLLHAYIACLGPEDLCETAFRTLDGPTEVRGAIRSRLLRLGREQIGLPEIDQLGIRLLAVAPADAKARVRVDALFSHLYSFLGPTIRQSITERWRDRGTRGAAARWLKAITDDDLLFSAEAVIDYWRYSGDWRAAKLIAYRAEPALLSRVLPQLVRDCAEGWIVSRAALRAEFIAEDVWAAIRGKFPATYAYLCAKLDRPLGEEEALALVSEADGGIMGDRGLAIWALGQLGVWSVLDRVREAFADPPRH
jgi:hypothetical protein